MPFILVFLVRGVCVVPRPVALVFVFNFQQFTGTHEIVIYIVYVCDLYAILGISMNSEQRLSQLYANHYGRTLTLVQDSIMK